MSMFSGLLGYLCQWVFAGAGRHPFGGNHQALGTPPGVVPSDPLMRSLLTSPLPSCRCQLRLLPVSPELSLLHLGLCTSFFTDSLFQLTPHEAIS